MISVLGQLEEGEVIGTFPLKSPDQESKPEPVEVKNGDTNITIIETNVTLNDSSSNVTKVNCLTDKIYRPVEIVNATALMKLLILESGPTNRSRNDEESRQIPGTCAIVLFYARWCIFSSQAAPPFNALPRYFPHIKAVAINAIRYQVFNAQYGIVGVPTLMLIHNGKPVAKYNGTYYTLEFFAKFITDITNLQPNELLYLTSRDFIGPVSSTPSNETDYCLVLSWVFIAACALYFTLQSRWWQQFVELVQNTWRESNAQHEHAD
ncbi:Thioredoxin domain-containing protein 15 [Dufourea novaeangliae]|uniref:Thioredoxin domain-containing protein 15 n=2 Tax=Dufourea novaeangliae TaxID=178035 RepID=A0A154P3N1_DUFNO|nr:Thioredoxin domain-containing protein 15 [Dufourea novaeangliae]